MASGNVPNYQGSQEAGSEWIYDGDNVFVKIYNDTGGALSNGVVYALTMTSASAVAYYDIVAPATIGTATARIVVVNNALNGLATIPIASYGYVQLKGLCPYVVTSGTVAENDQLEVLTTAAALIDQGTNGGAIEGDNCVGVAVENVTTNRWKVQLLGKQVVIKAT